VADGRLLACAFAASVALYVTMCKSVTAAVLDALITTAAVPGLSMAAANCPAPPLNP
jgi:hypothetical protein